MYKESKEASQGEPQRANLIRDFLPDKVSVTWNLKLWTWIAGEEGILGGKSM